MKKLIEKAVALVERAAYLYHTEPVAIRMGLVSVLDVLVASGAISTGASTDVQVLVLGALNLVFLLATRQKVTPTIIADLDQLDSYLKGHRHAAQIVEDVSALTKAYGSTE